MSLFRSSVFLGVLSFLLMVTAPAFVRACDNSIEYGPADGDGFLDFVVRSNGGYFHFDVTAQYTEDLDLECGGSAMGTSSVSLSTYLRPGIHQCSLRAYWNTLGPMSYRMTVSGPGCVSVSAGPSLARSVD